jgi:hypothetical protein
VHIERCVIHNFVDDGVYASVERFRVFVVDSKSRDNEGALGRAGGTSTAECFRRLRRVREFSVSAEFAVLEGEDLAPVARKSLAALPYGHRVGTEHEYLVFDGIKFARRELLEILGLGSDLEKFLDRLSPAPSTQRSRSIKAMIGL